MNIKPCPFCGCEATVNTRIIDQPNLQERHWSVVCLTCKAKSSEHEVPEMAIAFWNRRQLEVKSELTMEDIALLTALATAEKENWASNILITLYKESQKRGLIIKS